MPTHAIRANSLMALMRLKNREFNPMMVVKTAKDGWKGRAFEGFDHCFAGGLCMVEDLTVL